MHTDDIFLIFLDVIVCNSIIYDYICITKNNLLKLEKMRKFAIIKKSAGYSVKSFDDETKAREYAESCNRWCYNGEKDFIVCTWEGGCFKEVA